MKERRNLSFVFFQLFGVIAAIFNSLLDPSDDEGYKNGKYPIAKYVGNFAFGEPVKRADYT